MTASSCSFSGAPLVGAARRSRILRVLASLFLAPVVVFATPLTAQAATSGVATFTMSTEMNTQAALCKIPWGRTSGGISIGSSSRCDAGADWTPGFCQPYEGACGSYGLVIKDSAGGTCGSAALDPFEPSGTGPASAAAALGGGFAAINWASCVPVSMCLSYYYDPPSAAILYGLETVDVVSCVPLDVESPTTGWEPPAEGEWGSCLWGTPMAVAATHKNVYQTNVKDKLKLGFYNRYPEPEDGNGLHWQMQVFDPPQNVPTSPTQAPNSPYSYTNTTGQDPSVNGFWTSDTLWENDPYGLAGSHDGIPGLPWGVQVTTMHGPTANGVQVGYTNPAKCSFWFGPKIRTEDHPTYGMADPWDGLTSFNEPEPDPDVEPPVVEPDPGFEWPDFDWPDLGGVLRAIRDALLGLGQLLKGLFVPKAGFFADQLDRVNDAWSDTAPGVVLSTFADFGEGLTGPSSSGCEGPTLTINNFKVGTAGPGAGQTELHPLSTCGPGLSTFASVARVSIQVLVAVGAMVAGFRILAGAFGVNATPGASS